jgi:hypothetical protein
MCSNVIHRTALDGSGKGAAGWFSLAQANITYSCPSHLQLEHSVNLDFVDSPGVTERRVAVELTIDSARELAHALLEAAADAERYEAA